MLKHYVGVKRRPEKALTSFNLGHNPKEIVSSLVRYSGGYLYPSVKEIPFWGEKAPLIKLLGYIRMFGIKKFATISSIRILNIINGHS